MATKRNLSGDPETLPQQRKKMSRDEVSHDVESSPANEDVNCALHDLPETSELKSLLKAAIESMTSRFEHLERQILTTIDARFDRFEARLFDMERRADCLQQELIKTRETCEERSRFADSLSRRCDEVKSTLDEQEQYQRRENIRIVGLPEKRNEKTDECEKVVQDFFRKELEITSAVEISVAHRLGKPREGQSRPIICRLVKRSDKSVVLKGRRKLREKKSNIYLSEDLTASNQRLLRDLKQDERVAKVWTFNCAVNVEGVNGQKLFGVKSVEQVRELFNRYNRR